MMRRLFAALYDTVSKGSEDAGLRDERRRLVASAEGDAIEIGAGRSANAKVARRQDRIRPLYNLVGCNPNRNTLAGIEASPLRVESVKHGELPKAPKVERPLIVGTARRSA